MRLAGFVLATAALAVGSCSTGSGTYERDGDRAYAESRFADAMAHYQMAVTSGAPPAVLAKLGAAGLRVPDYAVAAEAYRELAASDASRVREALHGLDLAAQGAERAGDYATLRVVLLTLQSVGPEWVDGSYALKVVRNVETTPEERLSLLPLAAATAPDRRTADSLLGGYGDVLRQSDGCRKGIRVYRSVLRRTESASLEAGLLSGRAACALRLGRESLQEEPWTAEGWFLEAVDAAPETDFGRLAMVGLGEARSAQGDLIGAALAYQSAVVPTEEPDSITIVAMQRLNEIAAARSGVEAGELQP